jgi:hypothetical protein
MANILDLAMLICAALGAMAFGILTAYAILRAAFAMMRPRTLPAGMKVKPQPEGAQIS